MRAIHNGDHCGDTYGRTGIKAKDGKLYVSAMFDCFDLTVLGLAMDTDMKAQLCVCPLRSVTAAHSVSGGVIVHSNRVFSTPEGPTGRRQSDMASVKARPATAGAATTAPAARVCGPE